MPCAPGARIRGLASTASSLLPRRVAIYEVGARDGLQNESIRLTPAQRVAFVDQLSRTGVTSVEAAAFVNPKRVPQMDGAAAVVQGIQRAPGVAYPVLVPNLQGLSAAMEAGAESIAVMTAASETFSQSNVNSSIEQSMRRALEVTAAARERGIGVRAYISTCLGCPFEGPVSPELVAALASELHVSGCDEVVISDTIGIGTPGSMARVLTLTAARVPVERLAVHLHDTYGQALANILTALQHGVSTVDSSVAGLGGCPFAGPGAAGNVATEDVVYMLEGMGIETGVNFDAVVDAGAYACELLGARANASKAGVASLRRQSPGAAPCAPAGVTLQLADNEAQHATAGRAAAQMLVRSSVAAYTPPARRPVADAP